VFHSLTAANIRNIVSIILGGIKKQVVQQGMELEISDSVLERLATEGFDPQFGARPLRRAVQRLIEDPLSEEVLLGRFSSGDIIRADVDGADEKSSIIFRKVESGGDFDDSEAALSAPFSLPELPPPGEG